MTGPAFPVTWVLKDFFKELFVGIPLLVRYKGFHFFGRGYQTQHVQVDPTDQSPSGCLFRMPQALLLELLFDEFVNVFLPKTVFGAKGFSDQLFRLGDAFHGKAE